MLTGSVSLLGRAINYVANSVRNWCNPRPLRVERRGLLNTDYLAVAVHAQPANLPSPVDMKHSQFSSAAAIAERIPQEAIEIEEKTHALQTALTSIESRRNQQLKVAQWGAAITEVIGAQY